VKQETTAQDAAPTTEPERYDFGRPAALSREHTRALASSFDAFARQWAMQLTTQIRQRAHIFLDRVTLETYDEYVSTVAPTTTLIVCGDGDDTGERGIVEFPLSTALGWLVRMVGGDVQHELEPRALTVVEQALLTALVNDTLTHLAGSLGPLMPKTFEVGTIHMNAAFAQIASPRDMVVVARFSMKLGDKDEVTASFVIPANGLLERLRRSTDDQGNSTDPDALRRGIEDVPVELTLRLSPLPVLPEAVLNLGEGDFIRLAHSRTKPMEVAIDGHVVAHASAGANGSRLACVITSTDTTPATSEDEK